MKNSRLHQYTVLLASWSLLPVITGAAVTSARNQPRQALLEQIHLIAGIGMTPLAIGLAVWYRSRFAWIFVAVFGVEAWLGILRAGPVTGTLHGWLASILFAMSVAIMRFTSPAWMRGPDAVQDYGWPSLRSLSMLAALLTSVQVAFGAGFRHSAVTVMPHLLGALVVALFIVIVGAFATNQFPKHPALRPLAIAMMTITGIQVFLGMTAFLMRMMEMSATGAFLAISVAHVMTGSLTFAASAMLAIEVRRNVVPRAENAGDQRMP